MKRDRVSLETPFAQISGQTMRTLLAEIYQGAEECDRYIAWRIDTEMSRPIDWDYVQNQALELIPEDPEFGWAGMDPIQLITWSTR